MNVLTKAVLNTFCKTGQGGGIDPTCGKGGAKKAGAGASTSAGVGSSSSSAVTAHLPPRMREAIARAEAKGYKVASDGSAVVVYKEVGRWKKKEGIYVYQDGSAFSIGVDAGAARKLTYKLIESVLT